MSGVGVKELKNRLTHYLRRTKRGEEVVVTERGNDVGPVLRQFLTRAEDLFGGLFNLTLRDKLVRGQVPE